MKLIKTNRKYKVIGFAGRY